MNELQLFTNPSFGQIRTLTINNEPWFIAKDVCDILEVNNPSQALSRLENDEKNTIILNEGIGNPNKSIINESGFYTLVLSSRKDIAKPFRLWVTREVLPQIRKTGGYIPITQQDDDMSIMAKALLIADKTLKQKDELIVAQQQQLQAQQPLVDFANHVSSAKDLIDISEMAKLLSDNGINIGRNRLFTILRNNKVLMSGTHQNEPYQEYIDRGYFKTKEVIAGIGTGQRLVIKTYVTGKGQDFVYSLVQKETA